MSYDSPPAPAPPPTPPPSPDAPSGAVPVALAPPSSQFTAPTPSSSPPSHALARRRATVSFSSVAPASDVPPSSSPSEPAVPLSNVPDSPFPSVPAVLSSNVPDSPSPSVPTVPSSNVPDSPSPSVPTVPSSNVPDSPSPSVPTVPSSNVPDSPSPSSPAVPSSNVPDSSSSPSTPAVPSSNVPDSPSPFVPAVPSSNVPDSPFPFVPTVPSSNVPDSPSPSVPAVPSSNVPDSPSPSSPAVPSSNVPDSPSSPSTPAVPSSNVPGSPSSPSSPAVPSSNVPDSPFPFVPGVPGSPPSLSSPGRTTPGTSESPRQHPLMPNVSDLELSPPTPDSPKFPVAVVVGGAVGGVVLLGLVAALIFFFVYRRRRRLPPPGTPDDFFYDPRKPTPSSSPLPLLQPTHALSTMTPSSPLPLLQPMHALSTMTPSSPLPLLQSTHTLSTTTLSSPPPQQSTHALSTTTPSSLPPPLMQSWASGGSGGSSLRALTGGTFTYEELAAATDGFSEANLLGQGGFGHVYKGTTCSGQEVAVKKLRAGSGQGHREFRAEVDIISRVHHKNLVSLVGFCIHDEQRLLVYEYVPNNTLQAHLHPGSGRPALDWPRRWKIAVGSAKGLAYLHEDCHPKIIHRDIKAANILLDYSFEPKVADFGLAKCQEAEHTTVSTRVMGTFGYLAPEYAATGKVNYRSDVFSFGVMLLELITGRKPTMGSSDHDQHETLVSWARPLLARAVEEDNYEELIDPTLEANYDEYDMTRLVACAAAAVRDSARSRPRMAQIVRYLEGELSPEDLNAVTAPGRTRSTTRPSGGNTGEVRRHWKMAIGPAGAGEHASSEMSEYGLNPSSEYTASSGADTAEMRTGATGMRGCLV